MSEDLSTKFYTTSKTLGEPIPIKGITSSLPSEISLSDNDSKVDRSVRKSRKRRNTVRRSKKSMLRVVIVCMKGDGSLELNESR